MKAIFFIVAVLSIKLLNAQYTFDNDVILAPDEEKSLNCQSNSSDYINKYGRLVYYIPTANPIIKTIRVNFIVLQDDNGNGNFKNNPTDLARINIILSVLQNKYMYNAIPSDPISGVSDFPEAYIRFQYGGTFFYKNSNISVSTSSYQLINFLRNNDPDRLNNVNVFFSCLNGSGGWAIGPNPTNFSFDQMIWMPNPLSHGDWGTGTSVAHEMGHVLDLLHPYDGNSNGIYGDYNDACCPESCNNSDPDFLDDIFDIYSPNWCNHPVSCSICYQQNGWDCDYNSPSNTCTNNIMGGSKDAGYFSPKQIGKIHRALYLKSCRRYIKDSPFTSSNPIMITNNETWDFNIRIYQDLIIQSGAICTLTCKLLMPSQATITVQSGGKLIIDGGLVTSSCSDLWQGIIAEPGSIIELKNGATIENAILGIDAQGDATVKAFNSNFTNNKTAIKIQTLNDGSISTTNYIKKCNFTTTDFLSSIGEHPEQFIYLYGLKNINIQGNTFKNYNPDDYAIEERGTGIYANYSAFTVTPYCPTITQIGQTCDNETPSTFENLFYGIYIYSPNGLQLLKVDRNQFTNNTRGVYVYGNNNPTITRNIFDIGYPITDIIYTDYENDVNDNLSYGIFCEYSTGYKIEENAFHTSYENTGIVGLVISYSGRASNQIYNNAFTKLPYAILTQGTNGHSSSNPTIGSRGLQLKCNQNGNNFYDIVSTNPGAVASHQGSLYSPAGNIFSSMTCSGSGKNFYDGSVFYRYHTGNNSMIPTCKTSDVYAFPSSVPYTTMSEVCPSTFSTGRGITTILTEFRNIAIREQQVNSQFSALVDANNTEWYLKKISQNHNPKNMKKKLLDASPWLSDTVMVSLIGNENYFESQDLTDVLVNNPQSATSKAVQTSLDNMTNPFPYTLRMQINANDTVLSEKTSMEAQLSTINNDKEYYANEIINYFLNDTLPTGKDSLIDFLASQNTIEFDYKLFSYYYTIGQTTDAKNLLNQIPTKYTLTSEQLSYYNKFSQLYEILISLKENSLTINDLDATQILTMRSLSQDTVSLTGNLAKRIICKIDSVPYNEWIRLPHETITPLNPLMGYVYESAECGSSSYPNCTLVIINENSDTLLVTPAITDNYGFFKFDEAEIATLNPDEVVTIATKNGYKIGSLSGVEMPQFLPISEWLQSSPISLSLAHSNLEWADLYSTVDSLYNGGTVLDLNGNLYVAGYTGTSANADDMLLIKYNPAGERLWVQTYNGSANGLDRAVDIAVDNENNCYVLCNSNGTSTLQDIVLLKYNTDGSKLWEKRINGTGNLNDNAKSIAIDASNNVYITGTIYSYTNTTGGDIVTIKYSKTGQLKWQKIYSTASSEEAVKIKLDNLGNVIVVGNSTDYITIKYNTNGTQQWVKTFNAGTNNVVSAITTDINNNIIVTGYCGSGNIYITTVKYSTTGTQQWSSQYNISGAARDIATDNNANIYVVGYGNQNGIIIKYNTAGNELWAINYNSPINGSDALFACIIKNDHLYVTGFGGTTAGLSKSSEFLTIKYDFEGNQKWLETFNTSYMPERSNDIVVSENNNVYVTGVINENSLYKMATLKYSQCPSTANLKSSILKPDVTSNNQTLEDIEDDELIQVINFQENKVIVYPNPYSESTRIELITKSQSDVSLEVFTMGGQKVADVFKGNVNEGKYNYSFSAKKLGYSAGTYILQITINNQVNSYWLVEMK